MLRKLEAVLSFLGREVGEISLSHKLLDANGDIRLADCGRPLSFRFSCFGVPVEAVAGHGRGEAWIEFDAMLGEVPFTVEAAPARRRIFDHIRAREGLLATDGRYICARERMPAPMPLTPVAIAATAAAFMINLTPEIEALCDLLPEPARAVA